MCTKCRVKQAYRVAAKQLKEAKRVGLLLGIDVTDALPSRNRKTSAIEQELYDIYRTAKETMILIHQKQFPLESYPKNKKAILTKREREVLDLYLDKFSHKDIADKLGIALQSIQRYITVIKIKLNFS